MADLLFFAPIIGHSAHSLSPRTILTGLGCFAIFKNPRQVTKTMDDGNVAIMNINDPIFPVQGNFHLNARSIMEDSVMTGFLYNDVRIELYDMLVKDTNCVGRYCDKNRIYRDGNTLRKCACYQNASASSRTGKVVVVLGMEMKLSNGTKIHIQDYCSHWFAETYLFRTALHQGYRETHFQNGSGDKFFDSAEQVINYISNNGGWRIIGWAKKGMVEDTNAPQQQNGFNQERPMIRAGNLKYNIARIEPMHPENLDMELLNDMKFDTIPLLDDDTPTVG